MDPRRGLLPVPRTHLTPNLNIEGEEMTSTRTRMHPSWDLWLDYRRRCQDLGLAPSTDIASFEQWIRATSKYAGYLEGLHDAESAAAKIAAPAAPSVVERQRRGDRLHGPLAVIAKVRGWVR
jgi:hypothetical protein